MPVSVFELFKIGIGPSSSHTVGPMRAAAMFADRLTRLPVDSIRTELFGSLGATGKGHGTDKAIVAGLQGGDPETADTDWVAVCTDEAADKGVITLANGQKLAFDRQRDLIFNRREVLPEHPNGMTFTALDAAGNQLLQGTYYSVGGGFVVDEAAAQGDKIITDDTTLPFHFTSAEVLLEYCRQENTTISDIMRRNEAVWRSRDDIDAGLKCIWQVMQDCVERGLHTEGVLPGGMHIKRRAAQVYQKLSDRPERALSDPLNVLDWVNLYALAVSEENAAGGRVVTAPTNGAAGIIPAVMHYADRFLLGLDEDAPIRFLLTAAAIGLLYKENASISGADVGCQGEVGVACSMAAGALAELMCGTPEQVENAAEIGMEHNLGLTCDPVGGLVQVPCIERNAMGAVKAINAARMAIRGDGEHFVSLDKVIKTMRDTGKDMKSKYKETARGGLAVNVIEC